MPVYRMYVDESGDHGYKDLNLSGKRFLGLTGVVIETTHYRDALEPALSRLKATHFPLHNPDDPVILHRRELVDKSGPFYVLLNEQANAAFCADLLAFLGRHTMQLFTVVLDKQAHLTRYGQAAHHPYHYCFTLLLERYRGYLSYLGAHGDVLAESRGGSEDQALKNAYRDIWDRGTAYLSAGAFRAHLTSKEVKLKRKSHNIAGLQVADILAHPIKQEMITERNIAGFANSAFARQVCDAVRLSQNRYGRVFLG